MRATVRRGSRLAAARAVSATRAVTTCKESRIGKKPVLVGKSEVKLEGQVLTVKVREAPRRSCFERSRPPLFLSRRSVC